MPDYLITGGAGFIGSHIVESTVGQGASVRVFDNLSSGQRHNIEPFLKKIEFMEGDLRNLDAVKKACTGVRYVLHLGAMPSVPRSVADPLTSNEANVTGTLNLLLAARDAKCQRVVFSSSSSVYGDMPTLPKREDMPPSPLSPYALHKLAGEHYCRIFWNLYGLETVVLRYFNVFGQRQDPTSQYSAAIPKFVTSIEKGESPPVFGDGEQSRDFSHVANVVEANLAATRAPKKVCGEVFNIACGGKITVNETIALINELLGKKVKPKYLPRRRGDILHSHADISKAERLMKYKPKVSFREGLEITVRWFVDTK
ncbi:MAG: SDR family oxidoreductase [Verrucomicrobiae bacterium]|nr:SDR family oxidoreductase [Verrucomicrobiae bacterium]